MKAELFYRMWLKYVITLSLMGCAFAIFELLVDEEKVDANQRKTALYAAFLRD